MKKDCQLVFAIRQKLTINKSCGENIHLILAKRLLMLAVSRISITALNH
ncbi:MAG: hypothetical protein V7K43_26110 [Nostoc sp.]